MEEIVSITHAEALRLIDKQLGEQAYIGLFVIRAGSQSGEEGPHPFVEVVGRLGNPLLPRPPRLDSDVGYYGFGGDISNCFPFPPRGGTIQLRDNGVDFLISDTTRIRVAWRGSKEVGDFRIGADALKRLKAMGIANPEPSDDPYLRRFLAKAKCAPAEILEASSTERTVGSGEEKRRIMVLRVRVELEGEPSFEAQLERACLLDDELEESITRGGSFKGAPETRQKIDVAYDPKDHEQIIPYPGEEDDDASDEAGGERRFRLRGILGGPSTRPNP